MTRALEGEGPRGACGGVVVYEIGASDFAGSKAAQGLECAHDLKRMSLGLGGEGGGAASGCVIECAAGGTRAGHLSRRVRSVGMSC
eukprot:CAMPEP_0206213042 /NCGR_PEP_ID=MMETSP0047_2-20121206/913_1 /ASSEMBLY_ACC=CAM_ASM_000192 /TAXON_ID=195065 /ORGANISM="Chroomonas mesostigmatica_cf, Strain CCMP1168" /LENGTH=85 /DNA_ID=CAMNT_0053635169 /DNA_START=394 /DNA_END=649 /DNA_ORIENTATION=-